MKRAAYFTIIELMVVVAVIAILMSILLPALSSARGRVKDSGCTGNMRQIGIAIVGYINDYNMFLPPILGAQISGCPAQGDWILKLSPYLGKNIDSSDRNPATYNAVVPVRSNPSGIFLCHATQPNTSGVMRWSYGPTVCAGSEDEFQGSCKGGFTRWMGSSGNGPYTAKPFGVIPSGSILIIDKTIYNGSDDGEPYDYNFPTYACTNNAATYPFWAPAARHGAGRKSNFLFMDSHVQLLTVWPYGGYAKFNDTTWCQR